MTKKILLFALSILILTGCTKQTEKKEIVWSKLLSDSFVDRHPGHVVYDSLFTKKHWNYEQGLILEALRQEYLHSGDEKYYEFIKGNIDQFVEVDGTICTYEEDKYNLDLVAPGRSLIYLYQVTGEEKYKIAAGHLRKQLENQPKTPSGGFWHKKIYPNQMWLDGLYMAEPFLAEYSKELSNYQDFDEIAHEFTLIYKHVKDEKTGLLYHCWDESKEQKWANPETGASPHFWGRAMGWYLMGLVDVLDYMPVNHPKREELIQILNSVSEALIKVKDPVTNLWYQIVNLPNREGNYLESSASTMCTYAFAKGYNMGYLSEKFLDQANISFKGLLENKVKFNKDGNADLYGTCRSAGLGGNPYRNGSFEYYMSEPTKKNDLKGYGPFILAAIELEKAKKEPGKGKVVTLDNYYNNEVRRNKTTGEFEKFHYTWEDTTDSGFYVLGNLFKKYGSSINTLTAEPTQKSLSKSNVYIIVDPDTEKETEQPNYMNETDAETIANWVNDGGFLVLFHNDSSNVEFENFNILMQRFGFKYLEERHHTVINNNYEMAKFINLPVHPIFRGVSKIYMKEISSIKVDEPQYSILKENNKTFMVSRKFGKGFVLAISDPWLYNEYIDNRRLPESFENFKAADNLVKWILGRSNRQ